MKKRTITLLLVLVLMLTLMVPAAAVDLNYRDKDEITYKEAVAVLSREGIINGFEDGTFRPKETLTRAQASTILTKILGGSPDGFADFSDVRPSAWYAGYVAYCAYNEIVAGLGDGTFNPEGKLTGTAWSKMLLTGLGYDAVESGMQGSGWATNVANLASAEQLYNGIADFDPSQPVTRDEACQIAYNAMYDGQVPEPANDILANLSYSFANTQGAFNYPDPYRIPMEIFRLIYGDEISAQKMYEKFGDWGGNCYGMVSTAGILYQYGNGISPSDFNNQASAPRSLRVTERNKTLSLSLTQFIEALHVTQLSEELNAVKAEHWNDLGGLVEAVKEARESGKAPVLVCVWGPEGGHAIMGYDVVEVSSGETRVLVYDPNYPMDYCYITLTGSGGYYTGWSYPIAYDMVWSSSNGNMSYIPYSDYYQGWQNRKGAVVTSDMLFMTLSDDATIYDDYGSAVAEVRNGSVTVYKPGAYPMRNVGILLDEAGIPSTETTIWLPGHSYSVKHAGAGEFTVELTEKEQTASVTTTASSVYLQLEDASAVRTVTIPGGEQGATYTIEVRSSMEEDSGPSSVTLSGTVSGIGVTAGSDHGSLVTRGADPGRDTLYVDGQPVYENHGGSGEGSGGYDSGTGPSTPDGASTRSGRGELPAVPATKGNTVQLSVSKTRYAPEETITVSYSGVTQEMVDRTAWICVADEDAPSYSYKSGYQEPGVGSGTVTFTAPYDDGTYELRFFSANASSEENLDRSTIIRFTVERPELTKNVTVSVPKTVYAPEDPIVVTYSGVSRWLVDHDAWICVADKDAPSYSYKGGYQEPGIGSGTVTLYAPFDEGEYELRFFDSSASSEKNLVTALTIPFTVVHTELNKDVTLHVDKTLYAPEEPIVVTYSGMTQWLVDHEAWLCVADKNAPSYSYKSGYQEPGIGSGTVTLYAPFDEGEYELRFFDGSASSEQNLVTRLTIPFTVKHSELTKDVTMSVPKTLYAPEEPIVVTYGGVTQWLADHLAWICVADKGAPSYSYKNNYQEPDIGSGTVTLNAPFDEGEYELRFFDGSASSELNLVTRLTIPFTVKHSELTKDVAMSIPKKSYAPGESIVVTYSGVTQWLVDHSAWICVADEDAPSYSYRGDYQTPGVGSGTVTLTAPDKAGTYELRFFDGNASSELNLAKQLTIVFTVG